MRMTRGNRETEKGHSAELLPCGCMQEIHTRGPLSLYFPHLHPAFLKQRGTPPTPKMNKLGQACSRTRSRRGGFFPGLPRN